MTAVIRRLYFLLSADTDTIQRTEFLLAQLRIARAKLPRQVPLDAADKAELLKLGKPLGTAVKSLLVLVTPRTFQNLVNAEKATSQPPTTSTKGGSPRIKQDVSSAWRRRMVGVTSASAASSTSFPSAPAAPRSSTS